jgi:hypothetical protein
MPGQAWAAVASDDAARPDPAISGPDGLLSSRLPVLDGAMACAGTALFAAAGCAGSGAIPR